MSLHVTFGKQNSVGSECSFPKRFPCTMVNIIAGTIFIVLVCIFLFVLNIRIIPDGNLFTRGEHQWI